MPLVHTLLLILLALPLYIAGSVTWLHFASPARVTDWSRANRDSAGLAPDPASTREAVVQVYAARAWGWRGYFGVHTWIAVKPTDARRYTVYEVIGWRLRRGGNIVAVSDRVPDGAWYGSTPELLSEARGAGVDDMIGRIETAVRAYPYPQTYRVWPGPNSNTFVAFVLRAVPELRTVLPPTAVGKDYLGVVPVAKLPSGTGAQVNVLGALGVAAGWEEGLEVNLLGLTFGVNPKRLSVQLPLIGTIGPRSTPARSPHPRTAPPP